MTFPVPPQARQALDALHGAGFEAYLVGGCVRDSLLGTQPHDWDIATSALPGHTAAVFSGLPLCRAGEKHGTVTVCFPGLPVEITTFRLDGQYQDHRRPQSVAFSRSLREDLARRDFTINAMAWDGGLADPFGGRADLAAGLVRCVGDPQKRLEEDSLRILRGLRFAAVLGFRLEKGTAQAMLEKKGLLRSLAAERVGEEFLRLLCGKNAAQVLREYRPVAEEFLPELAPMAGLDQKSPYHCFDVWEHTLHTLENTGPDPVLRLAALLHDVGKPVCFTVDSAGRGHFYGHQAKGAEMAAAIGRRLRLSRETAGQVETLVRYHDVSAVCGKPRVLRWLNRLGLPLYQKLLALNRADTLAHSPAAFRRLAVLDQAEKELEEILRENACFTLAQLAVKGGDLQGMAEGPALGRLLRQLLEAVMDGACPNEREALLALARRLAAEASHS